MRIKFYSNNLSPNAKKCNCTFQWTLPLDWNHHS